MYCNPTESGGTTHWNKDQGQRNCAGYYQKICTIREDDCFGQDQRRRIYRGGSGSSDSGGEKDGKKPSCGDEYEKNRKTDLRDIEKRYGKSDGNSLYYNRALSGSQKSSDFAFKGITGAEVDAEKTAATATVGGADFYELTALSNAGDDAAGAAALAADKDIYINSTAPAGGAPVTLTKVAKGTAAGSITWTAGDKAYAIADAPTAAASLINTKSYLYIDNATTAAGDAAAFRYIGALSEAKSGWSTTDLSGITLTYDIIGISGSAYDGIAGADGKGLTYGYKKEDAVITLDTTGMITMNTTTAQLSALYVNDGASDILMNSTKGSWGDTWNDTSTVLKFQLNETWVNYAKGKTIVAKLVLKDGTTYESTAVVFPE